MTKKFRGRPKQNLPRETLNFVITEDEYNILQDKVAKSKMSRSQFILHEVLSCKEPRIPKRRNKRFQVRAAPEVIELIRKRAKECNMGLTDFVCGILYRNCKLVETNRKK